MAAHRLQLFLRRRSTCANAAQSTGQLVVRIPLARPRWISTARTYGMSSGRSRAALLVRHGDVVSRHKITSCDGASSSRLCSQLHGARGDGWLQKRDVSRLGSIVPCTIGHATVYPAEISHNFTSGDCIIGHDMMCHAISQRINSRPHAPGSRDATRPACRVSPA